MTVSTPELSCSFLSSANEKINISYQLHGNGKNKLLLISGMGTNGSIWQYLTPYLEDFTICTFDLRGTGFSSTPYSYSIEVFSEDALQVVDHLKWDKFHLGGISMGGFVIYNTNLDLLKAGSKVSKPYFITNFDFYCLAGRRHPLVDSYCTLMDCSYCSNFQLQITKLFCSTIAVSCTLFKVK